MVLNGYILNLLLKRDRKSSTDSMIPISYSCSLEEGGR